MFAKQIGATGKVYAVDIAHNFIDNILRTALEQNLNEVVDEVTAAGFVLVGEPEMLEGNYFLIFRRR